MKRKFFAGITLGLLFALSGCSSTPSADASGISETDTKKASDKEDKKDKKSTEEKKEIEETNNTEEVTIRDGDTITVDELLENPSLYAGKNLKVKGMFPQAVYRTEDGRDITMINNYTIDKYVEFRGGSPNFGGCEGIVSGNIFLENGVPVINAATFESIGETRSAWPEASGNSNYDMPFDVSSLGQYNVNYNMSVRLFPGIDSEKVGSIRQGETVNIVDFADLRSTGEGLWGKVEFGEWVCIMDNDYEYLTKIG